MMAFGCRFRWYSGVLVLLFLSWVGVVHATGPALDSPMVLVGDGQAALGYALTGSSPGSVEGVFLAGKSDSPVGPLFPWLVVGDQLVTPGGRWDDGSPEDGPPYRFGVKGGEEESLLEIPSGLAMRTRLAAAGQGVWLWELVVTNHSREPLTTQAGLALGSIATNYDSVWRASDGLALFNLRGTTLAVAAVSSSGALWAPPERGPLSEAGPKTMQGLASIYGKNMLHPGTAVRIAFVLVAGTNEGDVMGRCQQWMRLDASGKAFPRARAHWENWLAEGRTPLFSDPVLQDSMLRCLRTLGIAMHYPGVVPRNPGDLLDCAEAMRSFGRDKEVAAWLDIVKETIVGGQRSKPEELAGRDDGRDILMRYASLVSRQTIASGRLAGDLDLVENGLAAVSRVVMASNARMFPVDAVQLEAALHDGALLMRLARRNAGAERMITNAGISRVLADRLWSSEARAWTNATGIPDPRVVADAGLQAGPDLRYDLQYRRLRSFEDVLSLRDRALLVVAGARAFDLGWYGKALPRWVDASKKLPPVGRMALWLRMVAEGSLSGSLAEIDPCSGFRLETLYRIVLEMRHASARVASSFVFRDLRSRIRQHIERATGRDHAFVCSVGESLGELRSEMQRYGLPDRLEQRQVFSRLNRVDRMIAAMIAAEKGLVLDTGAVVGRDRIRLESSRASLELPHGWKCLSQAEEDGKLVWRVTNTSGAGLKPFEGRVALRVECGNRSIPVMGSFPLYHPAPLALHVLQNSVRSGHVLIENRGGAPIELRLLQSSPGILMGTAPERLPAGGLGVVPIALAGKTESSRLMLIAAGTRGKEIRIERVVRLAEVIEPDERWLSSVHGNLTPCTIRPARNLSPDRDGLIRISRTLAGVRNRGRLLYGIQVGQADWELHADERRVRPVVEGGWFWYDLGANGSSHITMTFRDRKAVALFSGAKTQLVVGPGESE